MMESVIKETVGTRPVVQRPVLWIVEDDPYCRELYADVFSKIYEVNFFPTLKGLFDFAERNPSPDLLISDMSLPDGQFITELGRYRQLHGDHSVIIVSGLDDYEIIKKSLSEGKVDYLSKPFRIAELVVKVERSLEVSKLEKENAKQAATKLIPLGLEIQGKEVLVDNLAVQGLTAKQMQILSLFLQSPERIVQKDILVPAVWGQVVVHSKALDVHIYNLRRKLETYGLQINNLGPGRWQLCSRYK